MRLFFFHSLLPGKNRMKGSGQAVLIVAMSQNHRQSRGEALGGNLPLLASLLLDKKLEVCIRPWFGVNDLYI